MAYREDLNAALQPLQRAGDDVGAGLTEAEEARRDLHFGHHRFHPEMLDWVAAEIRDLVHDKGIRPGNIVVLAPFLTDALRFSLANRLAQYDVPTRSHRPSRALRDEPATQTLLTLAALAHPQWQIVPSKYDVAYALRHTIADMDLVRAQLLAAIVYRPRDGRLDLGAFDEINPDMQQRITFAFGERYEELRQWIERYRTQAGDPATDSNAEGGEGLRLQQSVAPLDHVLARLFGEVLSQPGFGFHRDSDAGRAAAVLIESIQKFRWISAGHDGRGPGLSDLPEGKSLGQEYLEMVQQGVIAAQYLEPWQSEPEDAVLLAPAYTFLLANRPVDIQFWLNVGGQGWWERLYQPLTHPYVLSRRWVQGRVWTDADEFALRQETLLRLILGLLRRCRQSLYLGLSELSEQGYEQEGVLLRAFQRVLRQT